MATATNIMTFRDEQGNKIDYEILDQVLINKTEYVLMSPVKDSSQVEIYKINFDKNWNESLEVIEGEKEINMVKQLSKVKF
ncbi:hypothetical protein CPJCM30710_20220 [Clostridium polyendosporum]|uniref:DUF1292 domain-containing protein n=1 Tax=Clostridium polyendosporum TaxID=69208 RepID=A0A919VH62_9CLOT|nr:DUF1292 domain-containing protein [Clostridium polyendosporum]GIM29356.1 hypothetical protein CPJCM30710_20220 [Clostridium polyendosporum]